MPPFVDTIFETFGDSEAQRIIIFILGYFSLLWLSIIIWVTRDAISRSQSIVFQTFAIALNLVAPILGVLLYLIVRPSKTNAERYYEEVEHTILTESAEEEIIHCPDCQSQASKEHLFCHKCGKKLKTTCIKCKTPFMIEWPHCPHCGKKRIAKKEINKENEEESMRGDDEEGGSNEK